MYCVAKTKVISQVMSQRYKAHSQTLKKGTLGTIFQVKTSGVASCLGLRYLWPVRRAQWNAEERKFGHITGTPITASLEDIK